jgi:hypothetical protein
MSSFFLLFLYQLTRDWSWFHKMGRLFILYLEVKLIKFLFKKFGFSQVYSRNSVHDSLNFNVFMSDVDFSVVINSDNDLKIFQKIREKLKLIFPNIGEFEFYKSEEWSKKQGNLQAEAKIIWNKIRLIRKLNWQKKSLKSSKDQYSKQKHIRGVEITLRKLGQESISIPGREILQHLRHITCEQLTGIYFPHYSVYLEDTIYFGGDCKTNGINFSSEQDALVFFHLLPSSDYVFHDSYYRKIKKDLIVEELITSKSYRRLEVYKNTSKEELELIDKWISTLEKIMVDLDDGKKS